MSQKCRDIAREQSGDPVSISYMPQGVQALAFPSTNFSIGESENQAYAKLASAKFSGMKLSSSAIRRANLKRLIGDPNHGPQKRISDQSQISLSQLGQWLSGDRNMSEVSARKIESGLRLPAGWMDIDHSATKVPFDVNVSPASIGTRRVPLINYVQAGELTEIGAAFSGDALEYLLTDLDLSAHAFALEIEGLSMSPEFSPGDRVIIDQEVCPRAGDCVVAKNGHDEATFKKYRPRGISENGQDVFELVPLNDDYATLYSDRQTLIVIGTMMEHRKYRRR